MWGEETNRDTLSKYEDNIVKDVVQWQYLTYIITKFTVDKRLKIP
jgi:hypothetical protein